MNHQTVLVYALTCIFVFLLACEENNNRSKDSNSQPEKSNSLPPSTDTSVTQSDVIVQMEDAGPPIDDTGVDEVSYFDLSDPLFSVDSVMDVSIEIESTKWDLLRFDAPGLEHFETACPAGPRPRSFEWHTATVSVNGVSYGEINIRKKGLMGSMTTHRPSLKLKFHDDNRPNGIRRMTLNNADDDLTVSRECLSYGLFREAGIPAPRCGLASVTVNGTPLGVYTHIEEIKKPLLRSYYGDIADKTELFEITIADFQSDKIAMFEPKWNGEEGEIIDLGGLQAIADALDLPDAELITTLETHVNLDSFFTYWAMEVITAHGDGYAGNQNNSFVYRNPNTGLFEFIPWGTDSTFYPPGDFFGDFTGETNPFPWSVYANGAVARRLLAHPEGKARYEERLRKLLNTLWNEETLIAKINRIQATARPYMNETLQIANQEEANELVEFITNHKGRILSELDNGLPAWNRAEPPMLCAKIDYDISAVLHTNLGTLDSSILETGNGEATINSSEESTPIPLVLGIAGRYTDAFGYAMVHMQLALAPIDGNNAMVLLIDLPDELFQEGRTVKMDYGEAMTDVALVNLESGEFRALGFVMTGTMAIERIGDEPNGEVIASFDAPIGVIQI